MGFYLSPGVYTREIDLSDIIPNVATATAALVGAPKKGDTTVPKLITTLDQLFKEYGYPVVGNYFHYSAIGYLMHGNQLWCMRVINGALYGGAEIKEDGSSLDNIAFATGEADPTAHSFGTDSVLVVYAKDPGVWDNSIKVTIEDVDAVAHTFTITVSYTDSKNVTTEVEVFEGCSRQAVLDGFGVQRFVEDRVNNYSQYIRVKNRTTVADTVDPKEQITNLAFAGGTDGTAVTDGLVNTGLDKFSNPDEIDINIIINGGYTTPAVQNKIITICGARKDCFGLLDAPLTSETAAEAITYRVSTLNANTSYAGLFTHWVKMYDQWNDREVLVPNSGFVAGQFAFNDFVRDPWYSPAP